MRISDWSSDVCSSDLEDAAFVRRVIEHRRLPRRNAIFRRGKAQPVAFDPRRHRLRHAAHLGEQVAALDVGEPVHFAEPRSEEHTSELQSLMRISYAVFCLKKKNTYNNLTQTIPHYRRAHCALLT